MYMCLHNIIIAVSGAGIKTRSSIYCDCVCPFIVCIVVYLRGCYDWGAVDL